MPAQPNPDQLLPGNRGDVATTPPQRWISNVSNGWIADGSECEAVRAVVGISARVMLDSATLKGLENKVQSLIDCLPPGAALELDLAMLVLDDSVVLRTPITIEGNGASVRCPGDHGKEAFQIRCLD
ncbi:hypothetical protein BSKO_06800 [Bryopsis sp. KO-2023]|nr:hypothetical protein BSKO_06800 [Bryopsis sp. KO-2023]